MGVPILPDPAPENELYRLLGDEGIGRLVAAFYRQIPGDEILAPMYPADDLAGAEKRLRDFLIFRFGGPPNYIRERGHPRLRIRHARFAIDQAARDRWMLLMERAIEETNIPPEAATIVKQFLGQVATFLINRQ